MGEPTDRQAANAAVADYVRRLRQRLLEGKREIERQRALVDETRQHIDEVARWRAESERLLAQQAARDEETETAA